jgi:hypothetical protein
MTLTAEINISVSPPVLTVVSDRRLIEVTVSTAGETTTATAVYPVTITDPDREWIEQSDDGVTSTYIPGDGPPPVDDFILGETAPTSANSGAGVIRPFPTEVINGDVTAGDGEVIRDKVINGKCQIVGTGAFENCYLRGPADGSVGDQRPILRTDNATGNFTGAVDARDVDYEGAVGSTDTSNGGHSARPPVPNVRFCTIEPSNPTAYMSAIGAKNYYAYRNEIINTVDAFAVFSGTTDGRSNSRGEGNFCVSLVQFRPDPANGNRTATHNDTVQFQGNLGGPLDSIWIGNYFDARLSTTLGTQPLEPEKQHINAFTISVVTQSSVSTYVAKNWLLGGIQTFNGGSPDNEEGQVTVIDNLFERPGIAPDGPTRALVIHSNSTRVTTPDNHYIDNGAVVPVGNA